jgi:hypothetical protein
MSDWQRKSKMATTQTTLTTKLHPSRFSAMSGKMIAIVAHIIGETWTEPAIAELVETSDGFILARHEGDFGCNDFLGSFGDLQANWGRLLDVAQLTMAERKEAGDLFQQAVRQA